MDDFTVSEHDDMPRLPEGRAAAKSRLHLIYFALAAFDLLAVSLGLYLIDRLTNLHTQSVRTSQVWGRRLDDYADLMRMASAVNAPGNDVFDSYDVRAESIRLETTRALFNTRSGELREDLALNVGEVRTEALLAQFDAINLSMDRMVGHARRIFDEFSNQNVEKAGEHMALMDRQYVAVIEELGKLGMLVRSLQQEHFDQQLAVAARWRNLEFVIAGLIVVMVACVTLYGNLLARRLRRTEQELTLYRQHLEDLVAERTGQLEASHAKLRQADRLAAIGTLAAGLGHDMNNVLLPTRARIDALEAMNLSEDALNQMNAVRRSMAYLQQLSDGLHLLALDPDDSQASAGRTNLDQWWEQVEALLSSAVPRHVRFEHGIAAKLPDVAVAPHRLTQAVLNLVVNACEAVGEGGLVRLWAEPSADGRAVRVGVTDDGEGMIPEVRDHAMDPFFTTKKRGLGTGLGLSLVRGVAQSAGGSVEIDSSLGHGTTVTITLPVISHVKADTEGHQDHARRVAVSIADRRSASFVGAMVEAAGCLPVYLNGAHHDPGDCRVWITQSVPARLSQARQFVRADRRRRIITIGPTSEEWMTLAAANISEPDDADAIRRIVRQTLQAPDGAIIL